MQLLSIALPTWNKAVLLDYFLAVHAPRFQKYGVPLHIADNGSTDDTPQICLNWAARFDVIRVHRFEEHVSVDQNFHRALLLPESRYVWLFGDGYEISEVMLLRAIDLLSSDTQYDHVTTNLVSLSTDRVGREYRTASDVARDLPWLMTCVSCNIYGERLLSQSHFERFYNSNGLQAAIALDFMRNRDFCFYFAPQVSVVTLKCPNYRKTGWGHDYFEVSFNKFPRLILMLIDQLTVEEQVIALNEFFVRTPIFGWRHLLNMRAQGWLQSASISKYRSTIRALTPWHFRLLLFAMNFLPRCTAVILTRLIDSVRKYNYMLQSHFGSWREGR